MTAQSLLPDVFPVLDAGDFVLRRIELSDAAHWYSYLINPEVTEFTSTEVESQQEIVEAIQDSLDSFAGKAAIRWALALKDTNEMIGDCGYNRVDAWNRSGALVYQLSRECWGRGVMTRAANEVLRFGFERLDLHRVEATVHTGNRRSVRVLEKLGFRREGTLHGYRFAHGSFYDCFIFGLLRQEWRDAHPIR